MTRKADSGVSLLNVLVIVAIGAGLVQVMLGDQDTALERLSTSNDLAQAQSLASGGVTSVVVALRRDFVTAPDTDHFAEPWARAIQDTVTFDTGQVTVSVSDSRSKFDLNALAPAALAEQRVFAALLSSLDLPEVLATQITQAIAQNGPLNSLGELAELGIAVPDLEMLAPHVIALPRRGALNLNTASEPVLAALLLNPAAARGLIARRNVKGYLEATDLAALGLARPPLGGFTSDSFDVEVSANVGVAKATAKRRLLRDAETGAVQVVAIK